VLGVWNAKGNGKEKVRRSEQKLGSAIDTGRIESRSRKKQSEDGNTINRARTPGWKQRLLSPSLTSKRTNGW
jgi:hypothetical protein